MNMITDLMHSTTTVKVPDLSLDKLKVSVTVRGVGMFMGLFGKSYKV